MIERVLLTSGEVKEQKFRQIINFWEMCIGPDVTVSLLMWQRLLINILTQKDSKGF